MNLPAADEISSGSLFLSLVVSSIGVVLFLYGKKRSRLPQLIGGLVLMVYPYAVPGLFWMAIVGAAIAAGVWLAVRAGY